MNAETILADADYKNLRDVTQVPKEELYKLASHPKASIRLLALSIAPDIDVPLFVPEKDPDVQKRIEERLTKTKPQVL